MKITTIIVSLCFFSFSVSGLKGQKDELNSLRSALYQAPTDSAKMESWIALGSYYHRQMNADSAFYFFKKALVTSQKEAWAASEAKALNGIGQVYNYVLSKFDSGMVYHERAYTIFDSLQQPVKAAKCLIDIGNALLGTGQKTEAAEVYLDATQLQEKYGLDSLNDQVFINLSSVFLQLGKNEMHEQYIRKAKAIATRYKHTREIAISNMALSSMFRKKAQYDSALYFIHSALRASEELNNPVMIAYSYLNQAHTQSEMGNFTEGEHSYKNFINLPNLPPFDHTRFLYFFGQFYVEHQKYQSAEHYLKTALEKARELDAKDLQMNILTELLITYERQNKYHPAYLAMKEFQGLADEIQNLEQQKKVEELTLKYETQKKEKEIIALRAENAEQQLTLVKESTKAQARYWWGITATLFLLALGIAFWLFIKNSAHRHRLIEKETALKEEKLRQMKQEQKNLALHAMLKGEEFERSRLAKELHDGVGILLSSLKLRLDPPSEKAEKEHNLHKLVDKASSSLRRITHNMMPETLMKFGLIAAVEDLCDEINYGKNLRVNLQHFEVKPHIFENTAIQVYRILQELLNNVIKHAQATEVLVQLLQRNNHLYITVEDDGIGIDQSAFDNPGHGLRNIKSRVNYLNGKLTWDAAKDRGTTVSIEIQLIQQHDQVITH